MMLDLDLQNYAYKCFNNIKKVLNTVQLPNGYFKASLNDKTILKRKIYLFYIILLQQVVKQQFLMIILKNQHA